METLHVKIETDEVINSKRKMLYTEMNLLNMIKNIEDYSNFRILELKTKLTLKSKLRQLKENIKVLENLLPKAKMKSLNLELEKITKTPKNKLKRELEEIREELKKLG